MPYPIEEKLVIAVSSSALFALDEADNIFRTQGVKAYREYQRFLKTSIVTARSAPAHRRVINTLREWNISVDEIHFLGGMDKGRIMEILKPHIFFDDQKTPHLEAVSKFAPAVHIPFGIMAGE